MIELIDENVGRMMAALENSGQRENIVVIFTSDHGEMLGD
ncbi:MAG: sulfatase-like hydrolase/transferase, partial [Spirochaetales bacterium]|nr:sulfatase-like hydrolase/transferase [Spirochaetales bacterium]